MSNANCYLRKSSFCSAASFSLCLINPTLFRNRQMVDNETSGLVVSSNSQAISRRYMLSEWDWMKLCNAMPCQSDWPSLAYLDKVFFAIMGIQWNPSITDTIGNQYFVPYNEVSLTQGLQDIPVGVVCVIWRLELHFQSSTLLYAGRKG